MRYNHGGCIGEITSLPGCDQVAVSHHVFVPEWKRGRGLGGSAMAQRLLTIRDLGYDYALCTVRSDNEKEKTILRNNCWKRLDLFRSQATGNHVELWGRVVSQLERYYDPDSPEYRRYAEWEKMWENRE